MNSKCQIITSLLTCFIIIFHSGFIVKQSNAQNRELSSEILVYILPDSLLFPAGYEDEMTPNQLTIPSIKLQKAFVKIHAEKIARAFAQIADQDTIIVREDGEKIKLMQMSRIFRIRLPNKDYVKQAINILELEPSILFAEKHSDMQIHSNDALYPNQWHLNNTGQTGGMPDADIDAPEAWAIFAGSTSIKLGIIDTGVEISHDDLTGKTTGDLPESYPYDGYAHGTHVAGIAAAKHGAGDVRGVDANTQVLSRKVFSGYIYDPYYGTDRPKWAGDDNAYNKIKSAVDNGAHILNNSYGGSSYSTTLRAAFAYAYKMNRACVASMGNENSEATLYPAGFGQGIMAVGSTDHNDDRSSFSNYGNHIDVSSPGSSILSTWRGNGYRTISGTSMAAPGVSGIATLLKGYNTNLYNADSNPMYLWY